MKWEMEILSPTSYFSSSNWSSSLEESSTRSTKWTAQENKIFENALAVHDKDTSDRWQKVADLIPGKTVWDVMRQYKELEDDLSSIEAGLVPIPGYSTSPFTLDWGSSHHHGFKQSYCVGAGKRPSCSRSSDQERKKGVPWTEEEHKLFLLGLKKYGKGDWRNISRNFVITRTPTQVASHAQKYFIRQLSGGKDKRRASIHDITTVNINDHHQTSPSQDGKSPPSPNKPSAHSQQQNFQWNQPNGGQEMTFSSTHGNSFLSNPYGINSYGLKMNGQSLQRSVMHEPFFGSQNMFFQMQSAQHYPHG